MDWGVRRGREEGLGLHGWGSGVRESGVAGTDRWESGIRGRGGGRVELMLE